MARDLLLVAVLLFQFLVSDSVVRFLQLHMADHSIAVAISPLTRREIVIDNR